MTRTGYLHKTGHSKAEKRVYLLSHFQFSSYHGRDRGLKDHPSIPRNTIAFCSHGLDHDQHSRTSKTEAKQIKVKQIKVKLFLLLTSSIQRRESKPRYFQPSIVDWIISPPECSGIEVCIYRYISTSEGPDVQDDSVHWQYKSCSSKLSTAPRRTPGGCVMAIPAAKRAIR